MVEMTIIPSTARIRLGLLSKWRMFWATPWMIYSQKSTTPAAIRSLHFRKFSRFVLREILIAHCGLLCFGHGDYLSISWEVHDSPFGMKLLEQPVPGRHSRKTTKPSAGCVAKRARGSLLG